MWYSYTLTDSHTLHSYTLTDNLDQLCLLSSLISIPVEQFQFLDGASRAGTVHFYTLWKVVIYCGMSKFQKWGISERGTPMLPLCSLTGFMQRGKKVIFPEIREKAYFERISGRNWCCQGDLFSRIISFCHSKIFK